MYSPLQRIGAANPRPGLNAYSFQGLLAENAKDPHSGIDLFGVCDFCAKHDIDGVDLTGYFFPGYPHVPEGHYLARLKRHAQHLGLHISGTGVRNDFTTADKAVRDAGIQHIKEWIEVAARLGASTIRVFADCQGPFKSWQEASGNVSREAVETGMADALRECADHGERFGILVAVQNHGDFIRTGEQHLSLLRRVDHDWCAALVDTGMYLTDDPYADIALMAPYAVNWQIKETTASRLDSPRIDLSRLVTILRQSGYRGYVPIETLAMGRKDYDPFAEVAGLLSALRAALAG
jgi:sugar phosphate isomerase/epimerase